MLNKYAIVESSDFKRIDLQFEGSGGDGGRRACLAGYGKLRLQS